MISQYILSPLQAGILKVKCVLWLVHHQMAAETFLTTNENTQLSTSLFALTDTELPNNHISMLLLVKMWLCIDDAVYHHGNYSPVWSVRGTSSHKSSLGMIISHVGQEMTNYRWSYFSVWYYTVCSSYAASLFPTDLSEFEFTLKFASMLTLPHLSDNLSADRAEQRDSVGVSITGELLKVTEQEGWVSVTVRQRGTGICNETFRPLLSFVNVTQRASQCFPCCPSNPTAGMFFLLYFIHSSVSYHVIRTWGSCT